MFEWEINSIFADGSVGVASCLLRDVFVISIEEYSFFWGMVNQPSTTDIDRPVNNEGREGKKRGRNILVTWVDISPPTPGAI